MQHSCRKSACQAIDDKLKLIKKTCVEFEATEQRGAHVTAWPLGRSAKSVFGVCGLSGRASGDRRPSAGAWKPPRNSLDAFSLIPCNLSLRELFPALRTFALCCSNRVSKRLRFYLPRQEPVREPSRTHQSAENTAPEPSSGPRFCRIGPPPFPTALSMEGRPFLAHRK